MSSSHRWKNVDKESDTPHLRRLRIAERDATSLAKALRRQIRNEEQKRSTR